ncbi:MAG TPA: tannase/feruloyl esterase family alpha/beta hydrolase [Rhizobiaceae bacterium]|nr:tannase/feruloyl esterase family alpha/beta hydrolase [Rhizobiaceae bacterium]
MRKKHIVAPCLTAGVFLALMATAWAEPAVECGSLNEPGLFTDTLVTSATLIPEKDGVPEHCRVTGAIQPTPGSRIGVEFRLPNEWNGKFLGIGGGGFGGQIRAENFSDPLKRGYASAQTDIGHSANDDEWPIYGPGLPNEDAVRDYAWRSFHLMTVVGKQAAEHYGGRKPDRSYWLGCSTGGRQGFVHAQRFPESYDGIVAGAPVYSNRVQARSIVRDNLLWGEGSDMSMPAGKMPLVTKAVTEACDEADGVKDGIIGNPEQCKWDPSELACDGADTTQCLTPPEVKAIGMIYDGVKLADGSQYYPGQPRGSDAGWGNSLKAYNPNGRGQIMYRLMVHHDPAIEPMRFDLDRDLGKWNDAIVSREGNAENPDISAFVKRGGKMILYHGWNDPTISAHATIDYYNQVEQTLGANASLGWTDSGAELRKSARLFLAPGMDHCRGGIGPNTFDVLTSLEDWVEKGEAPDQIAAKNAKTGMSRPLCPYPQVAVYSGSGDTNDAANFSCGMPAR